jgi:hypothetical protein
MLQVGPEGTGGFIVYGYARQMRQAPDGGRIEGHTCTLDGKTNLS